MGTVLHVLAAVLGGIGHMVWDLPWFIRFPLLAFCLFMLIRVPWSVAYGQRGMDRDRARILRWRMKAHLRPGKGYASLAELLMHWGPIAAAFSGKRARPSLTFRQRLILVPTTSFAVYLGRAQMFKRIYARAEDQVLILAPPRTGKSGYLAWRIITHDGPVICTTTRLDLFFNTARDRAALGRIHVFNPLGFGGLRSTFRFNLIEGCEDPAVAMRRAGALAGSGEMQGDMAFWSGMAVSLLASFMHAAALCGANMATILSWNARHGDALAVKTLTEHPMASEQLLSTLMPAMVRGKTADSIRTTLAGSLAWLAIPSMAAAVEPAEGEEFDFEAWAGSRETVYLIAEDAGQNSPVAPLFRCFTTELHYRAGYIGTMRKAGKLDPPALFALDELCQVCDIDAPAWLADSAGKGIQMIVVAHSLAQLEARYGTHGAAAIWGNCGTKVCLGGSSDPDVLDAAEQLSGTVTIKRAGDSGGQRETVPVLPANVMRMLPDTMALVVRLNRPPVVTRLPMVWDRRGFRPLTPMEGTALALEMAPRAHEDAVSNVIRLNRWPFAGEVTDETPAELEDGHEHGGHEDQADETGEDGTGTHGE
jgi:type IV secretion system protein VirD4